MRAVSVLFRRPASTDRSPAIRQVRVDGEDAEYVCRQRVAEQILADVVPPNATLLEPIHYPNRLRQALLAGRDDAELTITVPPSRPTTEEGAMLTVQIEYELEEPASGSGVVFHVALQDDRIQYVQVSAASVLGMARQWMPCFEGERCSWDLEYYISTERLGPALHHHLNMASAGVLCRQFAKPDLHQKIFHFTLSLPTAPHHISFAAGLFDLVKIPAAPFAMAFCPLGMAAKLSLAMEFFSRAFGFLNWYLSSMFPFPSYYVAFLKDAVHPSAVLTAANVSLLSSTALFDYSIIDQNLSLRALLCRTLAQQYFGVRLPPKGPADHWLTTGISLYLARHILRVFHGNNDFRYGLKREIEAVLESDAGHGPICEAADWSTSSKDEEWAERKASLIVHILEHRLEKSGLQKILVQVWSDFGSERLREGLCTTSFLKTAKRVSGKDMRSFADQWIFSAGCPVFTCSFVFNRKRSTIEVDLKQSTPGFPMKKVAGSLLIRVHEVDGVFDHSVHIDDFSHHFELPVHAKAKKIKRKRKLTIDPPMFSQNGNPGSARFAEHAAEESAAKMAIREFVEGTAGAAAAAAAAAEEEETFVSPLSWIRLDPEMEWIASLDLQQTEYMLVEQLQNDRDVVAQYEAICSMRRMPSEGVVEAFERILNDPKCFYKIRIGAAYGLAGCAPNPESHLGALKLISFYTKNYALQSTETVVVPVPRTNNFESVQAYFIRKALPAAMGTVRTKNSTLMELVGQIMLNMMRFNDNSGNPCSDNYYVATMIRAYVMHLQTRKELGLNLERLSREFFRELERYAVVERIQPYYHNTVMVAVLDAWRLLQELDINPTNTDSRAESLMRVGNFIAVRLAALEFCLHSTTTPRAVLLEGLQSFLGGKASRCVRVSASRALASLPGRGRLRREDLNDPSSKALLWELFVENFSDGEVSQRLLEFFGHVIEIAPADLPAADGKGGRISLRITLPTMHELSSDEEQPASNQQGGEQEPDWFLEVAGEQGVSTKPHHRAPPAPQRLQLPSANPRSYEEIRSVLLEIHRSIWDSYDSFPFRYPIEASVLGYYDIIKHPMDLCTVKGRLETGICNSMQQFCEDLRLLFDNCFFFNQPDSLIYDQAKRLRLHAFKRLKRMFSEQAKEIRGILMTDEPVLTTQPVQLSAMSEAKRKASRPGKIAKKSKFGKTQLPLQERMQKVIDRVREHPYSFWFMHPVDPVALNIPTYFELIKEPMDLGTLQQSLDSGALDENPREFVRLMEVIFKNCTTFNPPNTVVHQNGLEMLKMLHKLVKTLLPEVKTDSSASAGPTGDGTTAAAGKKKIPIKLSIPVARETPSAAQSPTKLPVLKLKLTLPSANTNASAAPTPAPPRARSYSDGWEGGAGRILEQVCAHEHAPPFLLPVDPIALNIPAYPKIIKHPMDLSTVRTKLASAQYATLAEFDRDMRLVFSNCYKFNGKKSGISQGAQLLESFYDALYSAQFGRK